MTNSKSNTLQQCAWELKDRSKLFPTHCLPVSSSEKLTGLTVRELLLDGAEVALHVEGELAGASLSCGSAIYIEAPQEVELAPAASTHLLGDVHGICMPLHNFPASAQNMQLCTSRPPCRVNREKLYF